MPLVKGKDTKRGLISVKIEEMTNQNAKVDLHFSINDATLKDGYYYFVQIFRTSKMGDDPCYRTEVVKMEDHTLSFYTFTLHIQALCSGDVVYIHIYFFYFNSIDH